MIAAHLSRKAPRVRALTALLAAATCFGLTACGEKKEVATPFVKPSPSNTKTIGEIGLPIVATANTTRLTSDDPDVAAAAAARAIYSGGAAETQVRAVAMVDRRDWRNVVAASSLMGRPLGVPSLYTNGSEIPDATQRALDSLRPVGSEPAGGAQALVVGTAAKPKDLKTTSIEAKDPFTLALAIDRFTTAARGNQSKNIVVVSAEHPEFALPAAFWAAKSGDPIAFVTKDGIPKATQQQIAEHQKPRLIVLGPSKIIAPKVTRELRKFGKVERTGASNPVDNAIAFARYGLDSFGWNINEPGHGFLFARTGDTLQALALTPFANLGLHGPLLVMDDGSKLPPTLQNFLLSVQPGYDKDPVRGVYNRGWVVGTPGAISATVQSQLDALMEIAPINSNAGGVATPTTTATPPAPSKSKPKKKSTKKDSTKKKKKKSTDKKKTSSKKKKSTSKDKKSTSKSKSN